MNNLRHLATVALVTGTLALDSAPAPALAQAPPSGPPVTAPAPVERLGNNLLRVGNLRIDLAKKEVLVDGVVTEAPNLEFVAVTKGGWKAYESALELDTNAINFNLAMILIGLDHTHAVVPRFHFDPIAPQGDAVEIWVEWAEGAQRRRVRAEQLIYNEMAKSVLADGPWVYTGSVFMADSGAYLADLEGPLIGFVHTPAPIIESPRPFSAKDFGSIRLNPALNLKPGTSVTLTVRAIPSPGK